MKKIISQLIFNLSFLIFYSLKGQAQPTIQWQKTLGGTNYDVGQYIQQTLDGGFITAGYSNSSDGDISGNNGNTDFWVVKLNNLGNIQWQKPLGGTSFDRAYSIKQTADGGYIVAGKSQSNDGDVTGNHGNNDYWIVKLDGAGTIQWQKSLGGVAQEEAFSIQQTADGGFIAAGYSEYSNGDVTGNHGNNDYWVVKLDSFGALQWQKCFGGSASDWAFSIDLTFDGGYILAGVSSSINGDVNGHHGTTTNTDYWVVKIDAAGTLQWEKSLGGLGNDIAKSVEQTSDGGYIVAGQSFSIDGDVTGFHGGSGTDYWIVKLDSIGTLLWQKCLGGANLDDAYSISQTTDGGFIVAGYTRSNDGDVTGYQGGDDFWIVKLDNVGLLQWQKSLGGTNQDVAFSIQQTFDGGYIVAGYTRSNDGDVSGNHGNNDFWIVKLGPDSTLLTSLYSTSIKKNIFGLYPNPTKNNFTIQINTEIKNALILIENVFGEKILTLKPAPDEEFITVSLNAATGIYFVKVIDENWNQVVKKIIKE